MTYSSFTAGFQEENGSDGTVVTAGSIPAISKDRGAITAIAHITHVRILRLDSGWRDIQRTRSGTAVTAHCFMNLL